MKYASEQAIVISPANPNGHLLLGQEYVYEQKYDAAFAEFEKARALQPTILMPHISLINLANLIKDGKRAQFYADRARQQSPDFAALAK
jgi:lipoprotein NlpI